MDLPRFRKKNSFLVKMWDKRTPHQRFWDNLVGGALDRLLECPDEIRALRFKYDEVCRLQKTLKLALDKRGTSMMRLVAEAHGEVWDEEDDEKQQARQSMEKKVPLRSKGNPVENAVQVDPACEIGVREGQSQGHVVPPSDGCRKIDLQEERQGSGARGGRAEEAAAKKKKLVKASKATSEAGVEGAVPEPKKKKRVRKRPMLGKKFTNIN